MKFIVGARKGTDNSTPPAALSLPVLPRLGAADHVRRLSLNEDMSMTVCVETDADGNVVEAPCAPDMSNAFGPTSARLGISWPGSFAAAEGLTNFFFRARLRAQRRVRIKGTGAATEPMSSHRVERE